MKKIEMGNQQVTDFELGWVAGILDGEGHISMKTTQFRKSNHYSVEVGFTNTSVELLKKLESICSRLGVNLHWMNKKIKKGLLPCWTLRTTKISGCCRILTPILNLLTCKREKAELLLSFCKRRLNFAYQCKDNGFDISKKHPYTEVDLGFFSDFKKFSRKYVTSTTISEESRIQENPKRGTDPIGLMI